MPRWHVAFSLADINTFASISELPLFLRRGSFPASCTGQTQAELGVEMFVAEMAAAHAAYVMRYATAFPAKGCNFRHFMHFVLRFICWFLKQRIKYARGFDNNQNNEMDSFIFVW